MKVSDLERSKRLKIAGWKQEGDYYWDGDCLENYSLEKFKDELSKCLLNEELTPRLSMLYSAPTTGEMIEWLLGEGVYFYINRYSIFVDIEEVSRVFSLEDGLCNALANSVIWVLERKVI